MTNNRKLKDRFIIVCMAIMWTSVLLEVII